MAENRYRSAPYELREGTDGAQIMDINFARFGEWTEIDSIFEGRFMERMAPGAFSKTFKEQGGQIRAIFQHGRDPQVGDKPLGKVTDLREETDGAWAEVELLDAQYVRDIAEGLKAGVYGASFAFQVVREDVNQSPEPSKDNPQGIPERTVREVRMREMGPVTYPAYAGTSAAIRSRSLTDEVLNARALTKASLEGEQPEAEQDKTSTDEDRAPAEQEEATPEIHAARAAWLQMERREDGTPGALPTSH